LCAVRQAAQPALLGKRSVRLLDVFAMSTKIPDGKRSRGSRVDIMKVARCACVSPATVSRVTNGRPTVAKHLSKRVWKAIEELGYTPNPQARAERLPLSERLAPAES